MLANKKFISEPHKLPRHWDTVWYFYSTLGPLRVDVFFVSSPGATTSAATTDTSPTNRVFLTKRAAAQNSYQAQVCAPFTRGRYPAGRKLGVCVCERGGWGCGHARTADLWTANGNKVPTKTISAVQARGHTQEAPAAPGSNSAVTPPNSQGSTARNQASN